MLFQLNQKALYRGKRVVLAMGAAWILAGLAAMPGEAQNGLSGLTGQAAQQPLTISVSIGSALNYDKVKDHSLLSKAALYQFYKERGQKPYWIRDYGPTQAAHILFERVADSWTHGLNPKLYHYEDIQKLWSSSDLQSKAALELLLSDAFLRYVRDMSGMRVPAEPLDLEAVHWKQSMAPEKVLSLLHTNRKIGRILSSVEPKGATYNRLREELVRLVEVLPKERKPVQKVSLDGILRPGNSHRSIPMFRERLGLRQPSRGKFAYDKELARAVVAFQEQNGLPADGVIGSQTIEMMNKSQHDRILQIVANLERFRWVDFTGHDRFVVVNIPSAMLWALDDGAVSLQMPVIVGKPTRQTRSFVTEIEGMRFNPTWTVPPTIKRVDILPKLRRDISYLVDKGINLYRGYGSAARLIDPASVDWRSVSWGEASNIRMVQVPGDNNALGRYRVLMPNKHNIYLHDTNHPEYFDRPSRHLSSGCIRMKYPDQVARYVMQEQRGWHEGKTREALDTLEKTDVEIDHRIPVYILYYTAWTGPGGDIVFGHDVYGKDAKLIELLRDIDGFSIPGHTL